MSRPAIDKYGKLGDQAFSRMEKAPNKDFLFGFSFFCFFSRFFFRVFSGLGFRI